MLKLPYIVQIIYFPAAVQWIQISKTRSFKSSANKYRKAVITLVPKCIQINFSCAIIYLLCKVHVSSNLLIHSPRDGQISWGV